MKKRKIIHVITRCDQGGSAEDTLALLVGYDLERYDVMLIKGLTEESIMSPDEKQVVENALMNARQKGVRVVDLPSLFRRISPLNDLKALWRLFCIFRQEKPVIVHTHTSKAGIVGRWASFFARVPIIVHTPHGHVLHGYFNFFITLVFKIIEKLSVFMSDKIIAVSDQEKKDYLLHGMGTEGKLVTLYSAVNLSRFLDLQVDVKAKKKELGIPEDYQVVGTVGRLVTIKGPEYLIKAAAKVVEKIPKAAFVFIGDGELHQELEELAISLGVRENIFFAGWRSDVAEVLYALDVFVLASLNEGMGKVLVEAMAARKPIVASKVGGIVDLVKEGENGFLVPPKDETQLAEKISQLLQDKVMADQFGETGKKMVYPKFDLATRIRKVEELYDELIAQKT